MRFFRRLIQEESAQATVEYVLLLSIAVSFVILMIRKLLVPMMQKLEDVASKGITQALFGSPEQMHHFPIKPGK